MKLSWKNRLKTEVVAFIAVNLMRLWFGTVRVEVLNKPVYEKYFKDPETGNVVGGTWHRNIIFLFYFFRNLPGWRGIMVSRSRDGELISRAGRCLGYTPVRGSSSKGGLQALSEMIEFMKDKSEKRLCGTAVDGPQGPARKMKKGMAAAAKESGSWFIPVALSGRRVITFSRSWDKTIIPKPFSKVVIEFGEPVEIPRDASEEEFSSICDGIEKELNRMTDKLDGVCGYYGGQI